MPELERTYKNMKELENIKELGTGKNLREYLLMPNGYSEFQTKMTLNRSMTIQIKMNCGKCFLIVNSSK